MRMVCRDFTIFVPDLGQSSIGATDKICHISRIEPCNEIYKINDFFVMALQKLQNLQPDKIN